MFFGDTVYNMRTRSNSEFVATGIAVDWSRSSIEQWKVQ